MTLAIVWVLFWTSAPEGMRDLSASGYAFATWAECYGYVVNPPSWGNFACYPLERQTPTQ